MMKEGHRVILCMIEPSWIEAGARKQGARDEISKTHRNMLFLEKCIEKAGATVPLRIAGDLHHYARYQGEDGNAQLVTSGGGGAFSHPTHGLPDKLHLADELKQDFACKTLFPERSVSKGLCWGVFRLIEKNPAFAAVLGGLYVLYVWILESASESMVDYPVRDKSLIEFFREGWPTIVMDWPTPVEGWVNVVTYSPLVFVLTFAFVVGGIMFALSSRRATVHKAWSWIGGGVHGAMHLALAMLAMWGASRIVFDQPHWAALLVVLALVWLVGAVLGSLLVALYLLMANLFYGGHDQEVLSSQAIEDFKGFTRIHVGKDGSVTLYPIGIETVPKKWIAASGVRVMSEKRKWPYARAFKLKMSNETQPLFEPEKPIQPRLIEEPIKLR